MTWESVVTRISVSQIPYRSHSVWGDLHHSNGCLYPFASPSAFQVSASGQGLEHTVSAVAVWRGLPGAWLGLFFCALSGTQNDERCAVSCDIMAARMKGVNSRTNRPPLPSDRWDKFTAHSAGNRAEVLIENPLKISDAAYESFHTWMDSFVSFCCSLLLQELCRAATRTHRRLWRGNVHRSFQWNPSLHWRALIPNKLNISQEFGIAKKGKDWTQKSAAEENFFLPL